MDATIQTTIGKLAEAERALARVLDVKLDAKTRYHAMKLAKLVRAEVADHLEQPRQELFKALGVERPPTAEERARSGPSPVFEVPPEKTPELWKEVNDLAAVSVTIPWGPLTAAMMEPYTDISGADLLALGPLFELETETPT
jgi:hypothetical protein